MGWIFFGLLVFLVFTVARKGLNENKSGREVTRDVLNAYPKVIGNFFKAIGWVFLILVGLIVLTIIVKN